MMWKPRSKSIKRTFIGIDLGTTFSAVAEAKLGPDEKWWVENIAISDSKHYRTTNLLPTVVDFSNISYPQVGIRETPEFVIEGFQFKPHIGSKRFLTLPSGAQVSPDRPAVEVLRHLYKQIVDRLWESTPRWEESVVTLAVPAPREEAHQAEWGESFRKIAKEAGFQNVEIIDEPIAALLDIAMSQGGGELDLPDRTILVVDCGGGTCDVVIVRTGQRRLFVERGRGRILAVASENCGGVHIDKAIAKWLSEKYGDDDNNKWLEEACKIKEILSQSDEERKREVIDRTGLTYEDFLELSRPVVTRLEDVLGRAINEANYKSREQIVIDQVVLTGGGSKHPLVEEVIRAYFNQYQGRRPRITLAQHPQLNVSRGAAWYGLCQFIYQLPFYEEVKSDIFLRLPNGRKKRLVRKGQHIPFKKPNRFAFQVESTVESGLFELSLYCVNEKKEEYRCASVYLDFKERIFRGQVLILEISVHLHNKVYIRGIVPAQKLETDAVVYLRL